MIRIWGDTVLKFHRVADGQSPVINSPSFNPSCEASPPVLGPPLAWALRVEAVRRCEAIPTGGIKLKEVEVND